MADLYGFSRETCARIWRAMLYVERHLYPREATAADWRRRPPRTYRRFELTATLNAGSSAAVTWEDGSTGEVTDPDKCCHGLAGETGEAAAAIVGDSVVWQVCKNPGQPVYAGTTAAAIPYGASSATINVSIEGQTRAVGCTVPTGAVSSGKKYPSGGLVFISHERGTWKIISFVTCEVSA